MSSDDISFVSEGELDQIKVGRDVSEVWKEFTNEIKPQKYNELDCKHCKKKIKYFKKSERVKNNLIKCNEFKKN